MSAADVKAINDYSQLMAVANNNFTRQTVSASTKAILLAIGNVDDATAAAVEAKLQDDFQRIHDEVMAKAAAEVKAKAPEA